MNKKLKTKELAIFSALSSIMFISKLMMQIIPNITLLGLFISAMTLTFRAKALIPIYLYVLIEGLFTGFSLWWLPYLYIWLPLWCAFMFLGKLNIPKKLRTPIYMFTSGFYGLIFGILYVPLPILMFGLNFEGTITWIIAGIPFDLIHGIGNAISGILILTLSNFLNRLNEK
ncbi:MAG: hypothetical protein FWF57_03760 [Defluviitaleaceae bacterium]|nr:hypothetical protein [Defluviitaleaceae bacterium]